MVLELKLRKIGNSVGLVLPKEALAQLKVEEGDTIYLTESSGHSVRLTSNSPDFEEKMRVFESLNKRYRNALRELAK